MQGMVNHFSFFSYKGWLNVDDLLFYVNLQLNEILASVNNEPFAETTVITVGDSFQSPPVGGKPVYEIIKIPVNALSHYGIILKYLSWLR